MSDVDSFFASAEATHDSIERNLRETLNIAVVGAVSSGKSSLINALLQRDRQTMIAKVGAEAGTTTSLQTYKLDNRVLIVDSPGLRDIRASSSKITRDFLKHVDVGIFVLSGAANAADRADLQDLQHTCERTFIVLNKIDHYDNFKPEALLKVESQWKTALNAGSIYKVCCSGYDPDVNVEHELDIRGVDDLRKDIESFLAYKGKDILLMRHMSDKRSRAIAIIATEIVVVASVSFLPGASALIAASQLSALVALHYLYTGKLITKAAAFNVIIVCASENVVGNIFLAVKSFLPPTGVGDVIAAYTATCYTIAMLAAYSKLLERGASEITRSQLLREFQSIRGNVKNRISELDASDWRKEDRMTNLIKTILFPS